ncbi:MAG: molybdopterin-dependent oxidoreductase [Actinomycetota bacterium]|nr:molybdopterin-dependent oxidoreductase [Actinomycetota bacterium]
MSEARPSEGGPPRGRELPSHRASGAAAGLAGAAAALVADAVLHTFWNSFPFTPVSVAQAVIRVAPGKLDAFFIDRFQHAARPSAVIASGVGFLVLAVLLGLALPRLHAALGRIEPAAAVLALPAYAIALAAYGHEMGTVSLLVYSLVLIPMLALSALVSARVYRSLTDPARGASHDALRRTVVNAVWIGGVGFLAGWASLGRFVFRRPNPGRLPLRLGDVSPAATPSGGLGQAAFGRIAGLSPEITTNDRFYVVNEELVYPDIDSDTWSLEVRGLVDRPLRLSYRALTSMRAVEQFQTLECISNKVGGHLISNAKWTGIPMPDLLRRAGVSPGAVEVVSYSVDGFADSIPLATALRRTTLVAVGMNDRVLPREHGFPARLLVPGYYGMKMPKWLGAIEVVDRPFQGFWEQRGWIKEAVVKTMSRIDTPRQGQDVAQTVTIAGVAFAGDRGISRVEVSVDGGHRWDPAVLKPALSPFTWQLWRFQFSAKSANEASDVEVLVRAVDGTGAVQTGRVVPPEYSGSSGYHEVTIVEG